MNEFMPIASVEKIIYLIRGQKVMLDKDLADLYGIETKLFNKAVKRNNDRFPPDFMFQLTKDEVESKIEKHDEEIYAIFEAIRQLMAPPEKKKRKIGFRR